MFAKHSGCIKSCEITRRDDWQEVSLVSACTKVTDGSHFSPPPRSHGRPIANVKDLRPGFVDIMSCTKIAEEDFQALVRNGCDVQRHDVLLSKDGTIGRVVVYEQDEPLVALSSIAILRPGKALDPFFLGQALQSSQVTKQIGIFAGGSALHRLVLRDLNRIFIPLPSLAEQRRISAVLDSVDEAIAKTETVIAKLKQVRAGLLHDLLTRGLDENGELRALNAHPEQFQDSPLGRIPKDWEVLPLERVAEVDRGKFTHRPRNDPAFYGGRFPFIQTGDVALAAGETITEASQSLNDRGASVSKEFPLGTIAVTIAANIGDTTILGRPMYFPDSIVGIVTHKPHSTRWIELALRRAKQRLDALAPQSAQKNINLEFLRPLLIPVPHPRKQERCSTLYETTNNQLRAESKTLEKLNLLKSSLMADLLTGRVRVPEGIAVEL